MLLYDSLSSREQSDSTFSFYLLPSRSRQGPVQLLPGWPDPGGGHTMLAKSAHYIQFVAPVNEAPSGVT
jgi:hypothetical protein